MDIITYDDDCSVCTKFSKILSLLLRGRATIVPMHDSSIYREGMAKLGPEEYWRSFHVVSNGKWFSEEEAIVQLGGLLPFGKAIQKVVSVPPILAFLSKVLKFFQRKRNLECMTGI